MYISTVLFVTGESPSLCGSADAMGDRMICFSADTYFFKYYAVDFGIALKV